MYFSVSSVSDSKLKKVDEVKICTPEQRKLDVSEMHQRTRRYCYKINLSPFCTIPILFFFPYNWRVKPKTWLVALPLKTCSQHKGMVCFCRLYEQLEEVKHQKVIRSRQEACAENRLKAKEFHKVKQCFWENIFNNNIIIGELQTQNYVVDSRIFLPSLHRKPYRNFVPNRL